MQNYIIKQFWMKPWWWCQYKYTQFTSGGLWRFACGSVSYLRYIYMYVYMHILSPLGSIKLSMHFGWNDYFYQLMILFYSNPWNSNLELINRLVFWELREKRSEKEIQHLIFSPCSTLTKLPLWFLKNISTFVLAILHDTDSYFDIIVFSFSSSFFSH